jgi:VIT1/CCC1 family predicted Fe2+/Mn2+ transporter
VGVRRELTAIYERRGLESDLAAELASEMMRDPETALETHAREELGINPHQLGNPFQAAASSFVMFAIGAFLPLVPWLFTSGTAAIWASVIIAGIASLVVGGALSFFTGKPWLWSACRQLLISGVAAGVTFTIGRIIG